MVDRSARREMEAAIRAFLNDEIGAFQFDEEIDRIHGETQDATVGRIRVALWGLYDDVKDHKVILDKPSWDTVQRLLLVLASEGEIIEPREVRRRKWIMALVIASEVICGMVLVCGLLAIFPYAGIAVIALALLQFYLAVNRDDMMPRVAALWPFASVTEMTAVRKSVPGFRKQSFRPEIAQRQIRSRWLEYPIIFAFCLVAAVPTSLMAAAAWWHHPKQTEPDSRVRLATADGP